MSKFIDKLNDYKSKGKVYVMADVGSNYKSREDLLRSVNEAKATGADAVKYQFFGKRELHGPTFSLDETFPIDEIKKRCDDVGIDFLCTGFSPAGYEKLDPFVMAHKVASSESSHIRILEKLKSLNKPIILSTGAHHLADVNRTLKFLEGSEVIVMHANSKYPARYTDCAKFLVLKQMVPGHFGYSDHTLSLDAIPLWFKDHGISIYEKHFNPFGYTDTPDAAQSLLSQEFKVLASTLHGEAVSYTEENEARLKFVRRVVATQDLKAGDVLQEGINMGIFRARTDDAKGLNSFFIDRLEGKTLKKDLIVGEGISLSDV